MAPRPPRRKQPAARRTGFGSGAWAVLAVVAAFTLAAWAWPVSRWVALVYVLASAATFIAYAVDKSAARQGRWRTPESTLHGLALAGGWPGAWLAQRLLRHKSSKRDFLAVYRVTVLLNLAAFFVWHSRWAQRLLA